MVYKEQPKNFKFDLEVVACLIECQGKILLLLRNTKKPHGGKWGLPAGKRDITDDNRNHALIREIKEETGLTFDEKDLEFYNTFYVSQAKNNFLYHYYHTRLEKFPEVKIKEDEHQMFTWLSPEEALLLSIVPDEDFCLKDYYNLK